MSKVKARKAAVTGGTRTLLRIDASPRDDDRSRYCRRGNRDRRRTSARVTAPRQRKVDTMEETGYENWHHRDG
jgi:hypothetical protein